MPVTDVVKAAASRRCFYITDLLCKWYKDLRFRQMDALVFAALLSLVGILFVLRRWGPLDLFKPQFIKPCTRKQSRVIIPTLSPIKETHVDISIQLCSRLKGGRLGSMPYGFPFHYTYNHYGGDHQLSYESYEFCEELRHGRVKFEYHNGSDYLAWKAFIFPQPSGHTFLKKTKASPNPSKLAAAHVQVLPAVMNTPYGKFIRKHPKVILYALAVSLETGMLITITFNNMKDPRNAPDPSSVVYLGTSNDGRTQAMHMDRNQWRADC